jgi:hypothetical protein
MQRLRFIAVAVASLLCALAISVGAALAQGHAPDSQKGATKAPAAHHFGGWYCPLDDL